MFSWKSPAEVRKLSKIFALYTNEMIKLSHRLSVWILVILMVITSFSVPFLVKGALNSSNNMSEETDAFGKTDFTKRRDTVMNELGDPNRYVEHETLRFTIQNETVELFATRLHLDEDQVHDYSNLCCYNAMLANYNFDQYPIYDNWLSKEALQQYFMAYFDLCQLNLVPFGSRNSKWFQSYVSATEILDLSKDAFFYHDYPSYLAIIEKTDNSTNQLETKIVRRLSELDPEGKLNDTDAGYIQEAVRMYETYSQNLAMGVDTVNDSYVPLTESRREQLENSILILDYQLTHGCLTSKETSTAMLGRQYSQRAGRFLLIIMLVIIAGSSISQEMATGSIKSLIIAPVKRWKIFTAKLLSIMTWALAGSILLTAVSTLATGIALGFSSLSPYYYVSGGTVQSMPDYLFTLLFFLADNISLFIYLLAAFTISCLTRNTGISVGISTGLVLTGGISSTLTELFGQKRWIDFLPFSNMNLVSKIFPYYKLSGYLDAEDAGLFGITNNSLPLSFSLWYLAILVFILLLIAYDGFVRRDIQ